MKISREKLKDDLKHIIGDEPIFYLKFTGIPERAQEIVDGNFYVNTVQYFRDLEESSLKKGQGDRNELKQHLELFNVNIIEHDTNKLFMSFPTAKATIEITGDSEVYLFCLTGINIDDFEIIEHDDNCVKLRLPYSEDDIQNIKNDFGNYVVIINGRDFRNLIYDKLINSGIEAIFNKVIYCEQNTIQRINAYGKLLAERFLYKEMFFNYQKEYRLAVNKNHVEKNRFKIGSIKRISHICTVDELVNYGITINYELQEISE